VVYLVTLEEIKEARKKFKEDLKAITKGLGYEIFVEDEEDDS